MTKNSRIQQRNMDASSPTLVDQIDGGQDLRLRKIAVRTVMMLRWRRERETSKAASEPGGDGGIQL
jgi:hypothetical protein